MNGKERIRRAMRHEIPDRVPVMCQLALGHYFLNMKDKWKPHEIWFSSEAFADSLVTLCERYRFDGILINIQGRDPNFMDSVVSIEENDDGEVLTMQDGAHIVVPWDDNPQYESSNSNWMPYPDFEAFDTDSDFDRLDEWHRYTWGVYHTPVLPGKEPGLLIDPPEYFYRTIDLVKERVGDRISIHGEVFSPFTHFMELFGYENSLTWLVWDSAKSHAILDKLSETTIAWAKAQAERGVDAVLISSAFAGGGFISPKMYKEFVVPYERKVVDSLHDAYPDVPVYTHTCGKLGDRIELMLESNTDGVDTLDPPPLGNIELLDAKERLAGCAFIKGNMNSVAILDDDKEQFVNRAINALKNGKTGGGYILSTACSVAPHVEPWKLEMLADIADEHGRYDK